jgi:hypothetical protein
LPTFIGALLFSLDDSVFHASARSAGAGADGLSEVPTLRDL